VKPLTTVVIPARDEERRIGACLEALAGQVGVEAATVVTVLVLDGCRDATGWVALEVAAALPGFRLRVIEGPARGVGPARARGMELARRLIDDSDPLALLASTDADTRVSPDWLAVQRSAVRSGAMAIGGLIDLDEDEARLCAAAAEDRAKRAPARLAAVRAHTAEAEHHQFSGASFSLTPKAYDLIGGLPAPETLEDEALEGCLLAEDVPISYLRAVRVITSARLQGRVRGAGLAHALRAVSAGRSLQVSA
jgi:glycosyltransferase involved in cell wall biosynthesis